MSAQKPYRELKPKPPKVAKVCSGGKHDHRAHRGDSGVPNGQSRHTSKMARGIPDQRQWNVFHESDNEDGDVMIGSPGTKDSLCQTAGVTSRADALALVKTVAASSASFDSASENNTMPSDNSSEAKENGESPATSEDSASEKSSDGEASFQSHGDVFQNMHNTHIHFTPVCNRVTKPRMRFGGRASRNSTFMLFSNGTISQGAPDA